MEDLGILRVKRLGNLKAYSVNPKSLFYEELKSLVLKSVGLAGRLKSALESVPGISIAFIFGSFAAGRENSISDVDLFIVGQVSLDSLDPALAEVEREMGRTINYVLYDRDEFNSKVRAGDGFVLDVIRTKKIWLLGDDDGLKKT